MKHNDVETIDRIRRTNLANLFNVYEDSNLGNFKLTYAINRTFNIVGIENMSTKYFDRYVVKKNDTWLSIAYNYYGDTRLWWLVCKINKINNPTIDPVVGEEIKLLNETYINDILGAIENN